MNRAGLILPAVMLAGILGACAGTAPSKEGPFCGPPIAPSDVLMLNVEPAGTGPEAVERYVRTEAGPYRLVTTQPIGLRNGGVPPEAGMELYLRLPRQQAAERGCDLVLVLGEETDWLRHGSVNDAGRLEQLVIVHLGVRVSGPDE